MASITTLDSGETARAPNITQATSAPPVMTRWSIKYTPTTSITRVTSCCATEEMFMAQLVMLRERSAVSAAAAVVSS
jgi:hypothetical protein